MWIYVLLRIPTSPQTPKPSNAMAINANVPQRLIVFISLGFAWASLPVRKCRFAQEACLYVFLRILLTALIGILAFSVR